jgi:preprotein translocase subunit SecA
VTARRNGAPDRATHRVAPHAPTLIQTSTRRRVRRSIPAQQFGGWRAGRPGRSSKADTMQSTKGIPLIGGALNAIFGSRNERFVKRYTSRVTAISSLEAGVRALTDAQLRAKTVEFRERMAAGESREAMLDEVFAVGREAMDRAVGIRNIFNPLHASKFDPSRLPDGARALYEETKAKIDALEPAPPEGEFLGCAEPQGGWLQVDIPNGLYEAVRELYPESKPPFRARPFDVQLIGAMVLSQGKIAEMKTGEGKTIVAPLATYLASVEGLRVHVVTVNDYLVQRDRDWTFPFFHALGLTVGAIHPHHMQPEQVKRLMYQCDVVYGTTSEFGFDYLRDNMKRAVEQQVQRVRQFAIVDEVDSILIDEARTPLIISGPAHEDAPRYELADKLARHLVEKNKPWSKADEAVQACLRRIKGLEGDIRNAREKAKVPELQAQLKAARAELPALERERDRFVQYYEVEMDKKQAHVTHDGVEEAQRVSGLGSFYAGENTDVPHLLEQAVRAHVVYERDRDYIVMPVENPQTGRTEQGVVIVDTFTGRPMIGRQWSDGLHQAVEAREGVPIKQETQTVATVTIQNFFKMYERLAGMTGTADTEAQEFHDIYSLDVVVIPTNKPVIRRDFNDTMFLSGKDKWESIVEEIRNFHDVGRPVLVGTTSVEKSEMLARMLQQKHQIRHEVLNAKQHEREANIIEAAGALGAVMIATNMAGRGTDIKLAPITREALLDHWKRRALAPRDLTVEASDDEVREKVYRKVAQRDLGLSKQDAQAMPFDDLEVRLLRHWTGEHTWLEPRQIERMDADALREALDDEGRFMLHRIGWVDTIEQLGGLHVVGTERHESRRIDNQLRGRSGRQGDKGSSRFFIAFDDDLMKMFAGETTLRILSRLGMKEGDSIEHPMLTKSVERAQRKVEERNFHIRKNILEYDEVMEHQRREFYGLRQRVLEGRNIKGLIFEYIEEAVADAANRFLEPDYRAECIAEYARRTLECSIVPERLRAKDRDEVMLRIRADAKDDLRESVQNTLGEYMPADAPPEDLDLDNFARWIHTHVGLDMKPSDLRGVDRKTLERRILEAGEARIDDADLAGVDQFLDPELGAREFVKWIDARFGVKISPAEIAELETREEVVDLVVGRALDHYAQREVEHPVSFAMDMTMAMMRRSPEEGARQLAAWANARFGLNWDESVVKSKNPKQVRDELLEASKKAVAEQDIEGEIDAALACADNDALEKHLTDRFGAGVPAWMLPLRGARREQAIRGRVESLLRAEMVQFERFVLLEVLDPAWKDHLYGMDQLRDTIGFRAFSQRDPRIEYKREGSALFEQMLQSVRDRVTDYIFKMRMAPAAPPPMPPQRGPGGQAGPAGVPAPPQQAPAQQQRTVNAPAGGQARPSMRPSGMPGVPLTPPTIAGPGFESVVTAHTAPPRPPSAPAPQPPATPESDAAQSEQDDDAPKPKGLDSEVRKVMQRAGGAAPVKKNEDDAGK